jgi:hypothetical protein
VKIFASAINKQHSQTARRLDQAHAVLAPKPGHLTQSSRPMRILAKVS